MPTTITAYYTFAGSTKARASQVNANFSNHRGTLVPVDPTSAASVTNTYNLGTSEKRWLGAYLGTYGVEVTGATTTLQLTIKGDPSYTTGAFNFTVNGSTTVARVLSTGFDGDYIAPGTLDKDAFQTRGPSWTGAADYFKMGVGGELNTSYSTNGAAGTVDLAGSTLTIATIGNPVVVGFTGASTASQLCYLEMALNTNTAPGSYSGDFNMTAEMVICRVNTATVVARFPIRMDNGTMGVNSKDVMMRVPMAMSIIDFPGATASTAYFARLTYANGYDDGGGTPATATTSVVAKLYAYELR